ncbi:hypothetical protein Celaphus_00010692 [Cervus elaphus hippelaphus]|uniref:Uncharacterized protein n=1 Tax=Cervus elaphus hippelaphus TaxID=46360 RepID=A0A212C9Q6_CEREH|nr:hypothetical protein Celaphus_00010692 [Cervus elaphus hippelaphus]
MSRRLDSVGKYSDLPSMGVPTKSLACAWPGGPAISTPAMLPASRTPDSLKRSSRRRNWQMPCDALPQASRRLAGWSSSSSLLTLSAVRAGLHAGRRVALLVVFHWARHMRFTAPTYTSPVCSWTTRWVSAQSLAVKVRKGGCGPPTARGAPRSSSSSRISSSGGARGLRRGSSMTRRGLGPRR